MGRLNFSVDEASLLKAYRVSSLAPTKWEDVDHEDSLAGQLAGPAGSVEGEGDPLGLGAFVECVYASINDMAKLRASH
jgi:exocyst complex component 2